MKRYPLIVTGLAALLLSACGSVRIRQVLSDPARYNNRDVRVDGRVLRAAGIPLGGAYQVDDGTGSILVISRGPVPASGSRVAVKGRVRSGVTLMDRSFGTTLEARDVKVYR